MAEFNFYATDEDVKGIFCSLSERGDLKFIPDRSYPTAKFVTLKGVRTEAERSLSQNRRWYLMGAFTKEPVYVRRIADHHFSVWGDYDGPVLSLTMPPLRRIEDGKRGLVSGDLSHPRVYWDHEITAPRKVPEEVKAAYSDITKTIKLHLVRRKFGKSVWIGREASNLIDQGDAIICVNAHWWDGKGNHFFRPNIARHDE